MAGPIEAAAVDSPGMKALMAMLESVGSGRRAIPLVASYDRTRDLGPKGIGITHIPSGRATHFLHRWPPGVVEKRIAEGHASH